MTSQKTNQLSNEIKILYHTTQALMHQKNLHALLNDVLDILDNDMNAKRATLTLYNTKDKILYIEVSKGLSSIEKERGQYKLGEGITGIVAQKRKSILIEDVSQESRFLDRTKSRTNSNFAFICVPIMQDEDLIGTISVDLSNQDKKLLETNQSLLEIMATLLADAVSLIRSQKEERELLRAENIRLQHELGDKYRPSNIIGNSGNMQKIYELIDQAAMTNAPVIILGASGTGKEQVAKAIHYNSALKNQPFISIKCGSLPEHLVESELFGHEEGAFTGALTSKKGAFETAAGGTIFIDEISDLSVVIQTKLNNVLQKRRFERLGGVQTIKANFRIITATSSNLETLLNTGEFREDLYYRLNVFAIHMPTLKERKSDITLLADHFLETYNKMYTKNISRISTPAINMIMAYHWPGNVRELKNCIERAVLSSTDDVIHGYNLPPTLQTAASQGLDYDEANEVKDMAAAVNIYERELIVEALKRHRGNAAATARALNTSPRVLNYKFKKLKINLKDFKKNPNAT